MFVIHPELTVVFPGSAFMERIIFLRLGVGENFHRVPAHKFVVPASSSIDTGATVRSGA